MFQVVDGRSCYVVDVPDNPRSLLPITDGGNPTVTPYAAALDQAIHRGLVTEAGKYAIELIGFERKEWKIYAIQE